MEIWSKCDICGRDIPVGELCYGLKKGDCICKDCCTGFENCTFTLAPAPTLTPPNEWVSVEDAMPPEHEPVMCIVNGKPKANITLEEAYQLGSWNRADGWIIDEYLDWEDADVSWWRKLPEPPDRRPPEGEEDT